MHISSYMFRKRLQQNKTKKQTTSDVVHFTSPRCLLAILLLSLCMCMCVETKQSVCNSNIAAQKTNHGRTITLSLSKSPFLRNLNFSSFSVISCVDPLHYPYCLGWYIVRRKKNKHYITHYLTTIVKQKRK